MGIQLQLGEQAHELQLEPLDLVVDLIEAVEDAGDFVGLSLREVVVALQHLQPLQQGGKLDGAVALMLALLLLLPRPLEADLLQANLPLLRLLLLLDPLLQRLDHLSPVGALQRVQLKIGDVEGQAGRSYVFSAEVSDVDAVIVGRVELRETVGGDLAQPEGGVLFHDNNSLGVACKRSLSPELPLYHFVHLLDNFSLEQLYHLILAVIGFADLCPCDPFRHEGPQQR